MPPPFTPPFTPPFALPFTALFTPRFTPQVFSIVPLTWNDWMVVLAFSFPVILIDEALKLVGRYRQAAALEARMKED